MSAIETIKAGYAAFGRNDPSVIWRNGSVDQLERSGGLSTRGEPYVGPQAIGERVFGRLLAAIANHGGADHVHGDLSSLSAAAGQ
jgi:hypothetical protein